VHIKRPKGPNGKYANLVKWVKGRGRVTYFWIFKGHGRELCVMSMAGKVIKLIFAVLNVSLNSGHYTVIIKRQFVYINDKTHWN